MHRLLVMISLLLLCACQKAGTPASSAFERPKDWSCIDQHLISDMQKNRARMPHYSALSQGLSEDISRLLIESEEFFLNLGSRWFDKLLPAWKAGLAIGCKEYPWTRELPEFRPTFATAVPTENTRFENPWLLLGLLELRYLFQGRDALVHEAKSVLKGLHHPQHFQCMTRHFLESLVVLSESVPMMQAEAKAKKVTIPWWVYPAKIHAHISGLLFASTIDRQSESLHRQGLAIVCNDIAPISLTH